MVTTVVPGVTKMTLLTPEPGRILIILNQGSGFHQLKTHIQDTSPLIQSEYSIQLMRPLDIGLLMQMKLMVVFGSRLMAQNMEVGLTMKTQKRLVLGIIAMALMEGSGFQQRMSL